jgi:ubiquinone/menaquinone biosynthesis C-methylase UbiE
MSSTSLLTLVEGDDALHPGAALDIGCGTGDSAIYLAQHGWRATGTDFVDKARAEAAAKQAGVDFVRADATRLSAGREPGLSINDKFDARYYLFARAA